MNQVGFINEQEDIRLTFLKVKFDLEISSLEAPIPEKTFMTFDTSDTLGTRTHA